MAGCRAKSRLDPSPQHKRHSHHELLAPHRCVDWMTPERDTHRPRVNSHPSRILQGTQMTDSGYGPATAQAPTDTPSRMIDRLRDGAAVIYLEGIYDRRTPAPVPAWTSARQGTGDFLAARQSKIWVTRHRRLPARCQQPACRVEDRCRCGVRHLSRQPCRCVWCAACLLCRGNSGSVWISPLIASR
jgi:hypothetical protein